jgi:hypothetical protein
MHTPPESPRTDAGLLRPGRAGVLLVVGALAATLLAPLYFGGEASFQV